MQKPGTICLRLFLAEFRSVRAWQAGRLFSSFRPQSFVRWISLDKDEQEKWNGCMKVRFVGSFTEVFPQDELRHVVFVGRSNVGKSSLINMLVGRDIARVSKEPGRTRAVNFFLLEEYNLYLVDLPGYGFAKVSKKLREEWKKIVEGYFHTCWKNIKLVLLLIDSLVGPTELDAESIEWLESLRLPYIIVLTKCDRASQKEISSSISKIRELTDAYVVLTSAKEGMGKKELLKYILN